MKERPIIFNAEMVNAILSGRKTQTRRPIKFPFIDCNMGHELSGNELAGEIAAGNFWNSTLGQPGVRLWVHETFAGHYLDDDQIQDIKDGRDNAIDLCDYLADYTDSYQASDGWAPSIHMPRWASRMTQEITGVRVERI